MNTKRTINVTKYYKYKRMPVVYKGKPLMPMCRKRVTKFLKEKKGILVKSKNLGWYLKLKVEPSGYNVQEVSLGIDPGTIFTAYSIVTLKYCNDNFQRNTYGTKQVQRRSQERSVYRRTRRTRLRHRKIRFNWRTGEKVSKTCQYYLQTRLQMIKDLMKLYPIKYIYIEDVRYNHYISDKGKGFSNLEVGKNKFRKAIQELGLTLVELSGYETKELRLQYLKYDRKPKDKSELNFYAHCFDAFVIANSAFCNYKTWTNRDFTLIEECPRSRRSRRRQLVEFTSSNYSKHSGDYSYKRYMKGHKVKYITRNSKIRRIRVKVSQYQGNHGPWDYLYTTKAPTVRAWNMIRYGYRRSKELTIHKSFKFYDNYLSKTKVNYYDLKALSA